MARLGDNERLRRTIIRGQDAIAEDAARLYELIARVPGGAGQAWQDLAQRTRLGVNKLHQEAARLLGNQQPQE